LVDANYLIESKPELDSSVRKETWLLFGTIDQRVFAWFLS
jgi:hypothetical protein